MMATASPLKVLHLSFNLGDAAVHKRAAMLLQGGAKVTLAGFRRTHVAIPHIHDCPTVNFGQTYNGHFIQRIGAVLRVLCTLRRHRTLFADAEIIIARNMEMLAIAVCGRALLNPAASIIYESLDIHRLLVAPGIIGFIMRALEGFLSRRAHAMITSSGAFIHQYFNVHSKVRLPYRLVENKVLATVNFPPPKPQMPPRPDAPPWRIGLFGIIRCSRSLDLLSNLVKTYPGMIEVVIRGRPALDQIPDFHDRIAATPGLTFLGAYKNPDDLVAMYREIHFNWLIDMYEDGQNSTWLLPNRLYEGGVFDAIPLARSTDASGRYLKELQAGVILPAPLHKTLHGFFQHLTPKYYRELATSIAAVPSRIWIDSPSDCTSFVNFLTTYKNQTNHIVKETYYAGSNVQT